MIDISNKRILFIAPEFYSYHMQIINFMKSNGAQVTFFAEDIYTPSYRFVKKVFPKFADYIKRTYINSLLNNVSQNLYDFVFVIRGGILTPSIMEDIKNKLTKAKFIMYQWDSDQQSHYKNIIKYFDVVKTFDKEDAKNFRIEYLPLYYSKDYDNIKQQKLDKLYDIVFYGAYHSDRLEIIKYIDNFCKKNNLIFKHHLYITKMGLIRLLFLGKIKFEDLKYFKTFTIGTKEILDVYAHTFAALDIELNIQNGLTMRTFETLGAGLKLITTNKNIISEPFYNDKDIIMIDRKNLNLDLKFFVTPFYNSEILNQYSFENWFRNLFKGRI